jgi:hypothetical protein
VSEPSFNGSSAICTGRAPHPLVDMRVQRVGELANHDTYWHLVVRHEALFDREGMKGPLLRTVAAAC